ncbi:hypothetical protein [Nonomuraea sp. NPDC002799]
MRGRSGEVLLPAGFVLAVGACVVAAVAFAEISARVVLVTVAVGLFGVWARRYLAALATGVMAWCFATGFLVHAAGELAFQPDDLARLGTISVAALVGCACGQVRRVLRSRRPTMAVETRPALLPQRG